MLQEVYKEEEQYETVLSLSGAGVRYLRRAVLCTRGTGDGLPILMRQAHREVPGRAQIGIRQERM